jgi:phage terminase large subunit-like protein
MTQAKLDAIPETGTFGCREEVRGGRKVRIPFLMDSVAWWGYGPPPTERWPGVTIPVDGKSGKYRFDAEKADRVCAFFPRFCSHSKGEFAGKDFALLDYQTQLILRPLFGWVHTDTGLRRFRKAYIEIPKKNGKTQLIAGLALYMLLADAEPGAEVYVAAADRDQARILFRAAVAMVESNQALGKRLVVYRNQIVRRDDPTAFFQVLSAEAATKHGPNIHCLIMDELHAQPDRELFETLTRGIIARRQPLILLITTAGDDDESICYEEYEYAKRVLSGTIQDEAHLPVIFEMTPEDDPFDPAVVARVNPAYGITISADNLAGFALEARNEPRKLNDYLRFHGNRWVNSATAWIPVDWWDACRTEFTDADLAGLQCAAGLDLAQKWDLAAFVVTFRRMLEATTKIEVVEKDDSGQASQKAVTLNFELFAVPFFWIPENTMRQHEKDDGVPYSQWEKDGLITATDGDIIDYTRIYQDITTKILPRFPLLKQGLIGYDPAFATDIAIQLRDRAGLKVNEVLQNYTHMSEPCQVSEAMVKAKRFHHGGHRIFRNHVENCAIKRDDAGRIRPVKPKKASKHIDAWVAAQMGLKGLMLMPPKKKTLPVYFLGGKA